MLLDTLPRRHDASATRRYFISLMIFDVYASDGFLLDATRCCHGDAMRLFARLARALRGVYATLIRAPRYACCAMPRAMFTIICERQRSAREVYVTCYAKSALRCCACCAFRHVVFQRCCRRDAMRRLLSPYAHDTPRCHALRLRALMPLLPAVAAAAHNVATSYYMPLY